MLGRIVHYGVDLIFVSTVIAGVKRSTGFSPKTDSITDPTFRGLADKYLLVGESVFDILQTTAVSSQYFKRDK
ncbi:DUF1748-domain-containing protein [Serendipita vermifera]|nr:DUF1748-domain-containing protein [Serendipita vermifera]